MKGAAEAHATGDGRWLGREEDAPPEAWDNPPVLRESQGRGGQHSPLRLAIGREMSGRLANGSPTKCVYACVTKVVLIKVFCVCGLLTAGLVGSGRERKEKRMDGRKSGSEERRIILFILLFLI